jgi:hypothetical protein
MPHGALDPPSFTPTAQGENNGPWTAKNRETSHAFWYFCHPRHNTRNDHGMRLVLDNIPIPTALVSLWSRACQHQNPPGRLCQLNALIPLRPCTNDGWNYARWRAETLPTCCCLLYSPLFAMLGYDRTMMTMEECCGECDGVTCSVTARTVVCSIPFLNTHSLRGIIRSRLQLMSSNQRPTLVLAPSVNTTT